jgi:hypothetical protein
VILATVTDNSKNKLTLIIAFVLMAIGVTIVPMLFYQQLQKALDEILENRSQNFRNIEEVLERQEENQLSSEAEREAITENIISFLSLYLCDIEEDIDRLKLHHNISNEDRVINNGTHIKIDSKYALELPIECVPNPSTG